MKKILLIMVLMMAFSSSIGFAAEDPNYENMGYSQGGYGIDQYLIYWKGSELPEKDSALSVYGTETDKYYGTVKVVKEYKEHFVIVQAENLSDKIILYKEYAATIKP